ncbi:hypothetical protein ACWCY1_14770 [Streptomyces goshikiensis]
MATAASTAADPRTAACAAASPPPHTSKVAHCDTPAGTVHE